MKLLGQTGKSKDRSFTQGEHNDENNEERIHTD